MQYHIQHHYRHLAHKRTTAAQHRVFMRWLFIYAAGFLALLAVVLLSQ